jgi:hypothetical protein
MEFLDDTQSVDGGEDAGGDMPPPADEQGAIAIWTGLQGRGAGGRKVAGLAWRPADRTIAERQVSFFVCVHSRLS